jgi:hypothetical protein
MSAPQNLLALRTEVLNHGFDPVLFGSARINQYLNDAQALVARRVQWYNEEAVQDTATVSGTATYAWPANFLRIRSLRDTDRHVELRSVSLRDIDRSGASNGAPNYYALDGGNIHLYPTPDAVYNLELRYWSSPSTLVNDTDVPSIPADWHRILWIWAVKECYAAEDDPTTAGYWESQFNNTLAELAADLKFPSTDAPAQAEGMWNQDRSLGSAGWSMYGW